MVPLPGMQRLLKAVLLLTTQVPHLSPLFPTMTRKITTIAFIEHYSVPRTVL